MSAICSIYYSTCIYTHNSLILWITNRLCVYTYYKNFYSTYHEFFL